MWREVKPSITFQRIAGWKIFNQRMELRKQHQNVARTHTEKLKLRFT